MTATTPLMEVSGVVKRYGDVTANRGTSLRIERGQIHALLGENGAGKTTLMRVLYGLTRPDAGELLWDGRPVEIASPRDALALGIGMVHQHDMLVGAFSVLENFELTSLERPLRLELGETAEHYAALCRRWGIEIDASTRVRDLSVGQRQWLSFMRVLTAPVRLLILDEPTACLTPQERDRFFDTLRELRAEGTSMVLITHKLDEVTSLCDHVTVMRAGETVASMPVAETSKEELAAMMVGRPLDTRLPRAPRRPGERLLEIRDLSLEDAVPSLKNLSLHVDAGEIVGVAGVDGNGQRALAECATGVRAPSSGTVLLRGEELTGRGPVAFMERGVGHIPEDRRADGLALGMTIWENLLLGSPRLRAVRSMGVLDTSAARRRAAEVIDRFDVRSSGVEQLTGQLSGGNQQKVILGRELVDGTEVVVAVNPTRGLDIGASRFVFEQLLAVRERGGGVVFVSYDLEEILALSDRVAVMFDGRIVGEFVAGDASPEEIGMLLGGEAG
ncbi:MAG: ABC transporter ATP-binding protein [Conexibacter sp.]